MIFAHAAVAKKLYNNIHYYFHVSLLNQRLMKKTLSTYITNGNLLEIE